jgi:hypothetical protein
MSTASAEARGHCAARPRISCPRGDALVEHVAGLLLVVGLPLAADRQPILLRLDREIRVRFLTNHVISFRQSEGNGHPEGSRS